MSLCRMGLATFFTAILCMVTPAVASGPAAELGGKIEALFRALRDPALEGRTLERRQVIRRAAEEIFDFRESARRVLGTHWAVLAPEQQERFVRAFTGLIDHAYLRRVDEYDGERVVMAGDSAERDRGIVHAKVVTKDGDTIPVDFVMMRDQGAGWRAYDVTVGGMSLVASYRAQFERIIRAGSYEELMKRLELKGASAQR